MSESSHCVDYEVSACALIAAGAFFGPGGLYKLSLGMCLTFCRGQTACLYFPAELVLPCSELVLSFNQP